MADMTQMYKIMRGQDRVENLFVPATSGDRVTRMASDPMNVRVQAARLDVRKNFFTVRAANHWNKVPAEIKNAKNVDVFKNLYKRYRSTALGRTTN